MVQSRGHPRTASPGQYQAALGEHYRTSRALQIDTKLPTKRKSYSAKYLRLLTKQQRSSTTQRHPSNGHRRMRVLLHRTLPRLHLATATALATARLIMPHRASPWRYPNRGPRKTTRPPNGRRPQTNGRVVSQQAYWQLSHSTDDILSLFAHFHSCIIFDHIIVIRLTSPNQHLLTLLVDSLRRQATGRNGAATRKAQNHGANDSRIGVLGVTQRFRTFA